MNETKKCYPIRSLQYEENPDGTVTIYVDEDTTTTIEEAEFQQQYIVQDNKEAVNEEAELLLLIKEFSKTTGDKIKLTRMLRTTLDEESLRDLRKDLINEHKECQGR